MLASLFGFNCLMDVLSHLQSPLEAAIDQLAAPGAQRTLTHVAAKAILEAAGGLEAVAAAILSAVDDAADDKRRLRGCAAITALCCTGAELRKQLLDACTPARGAKITPFTALQGLAAMPQSVEDAAAAAEAYAAASAAWTAAPPVDGKKGPPPAVPPTAAGLVAEAGGIGLIAIALLDAFASEHASVRKLACRAFVALTLAGPATCKALFELNVSSTCATLPLPKVRTAGWLAALQLMTVMMQSSRNMRNSTVTLCAIIEHCRDNMSGAAEALFVMHGKKCISTAKPSWH